MDEFDTDLDEGSEESPDLIFEFLRDDVVPVRILG
jgi:hypothetical protein